VVGVELLDRLEQALVADGDQLGQVEPVALVFLDVGNDEPEVGRDQALRGSLVAGQGPPGQALLFLGIRDHGELLDVEEVLIESAGRSGTDQHTSFRTDMGHKQPQGRGGQTANVGAVDGREAEERGANIGMAPSGVKQRC
jgi:hypothetical protein